MGSIDIDLNSLPPKTRLCEAQSGFWEPNLKFHTILSDSINTKAIQDDIMNVSLVDLEY